MSDEQRETDIDIQGSVESAIANIGSNVTIQSLIVNVLSERQNDWHTSLNQAIDALISANSELSWDYLRNNQQFMTLVINATLIAAKNHQKENLRALRNVILNVVFEGFTHEDESLIFLKLIDDMTPTHFKLLLHIKDHLPIETFTQTEESDENHDKQIEELFPDGDPALFRLVFEQLVSMNLINQLIETAFGGEKKIYRASNILERFLTFIADVDTEQIHHDDK